MQKVQVDSAGGFDHLKLVAASSPAPGPGEVLVRTHAAGVNFADCVVRMGLYPSAKEYVGWPITPGFEFSGHVQGLGEGVGELNIGDPVFGVTRFGAYASEVVAPRHQIFALPAELDLVQAASFPVMFLTAWYALCELVRLRPGYRVLVHSAAGGVGSALVQIARAKECFVVGVVGRSHKVQAAKDNGAQAVIDKSNEDLWDAAQRYAPEGYDVILDANGYETLRQSYKHLRPAGKLVIYGFHTMLQKGKGRPNWAKLALTYLQTPRFDPMRLTNENKAVLAFNLSYLFERAELLAEAMEELLRWLREGKLHPPEIHTRALSEVADAHRALQSGETVGKQALLVGSAAPV